ncbi:MAG: helical backbone metal receptor [Polyangiaceae bacterium]
MIRSRWKGFFSSLFLITCALSEEAACSKKSDAVTAANDASMTAKRVVSLSPSTTEAMFAIHANDLLVGRSRYCDYPVEAKALPEVGGYADPNFEAILALRPDLVIGARGPAGPSLADRLSTHGAATYFPETETLAAIDTMVLGLGDRTAHVEDAQKLVAAMHAREDGVTAIVRDLPHPRVLMIFGLTPTVVAGPSSYADEIIKRAGGENVVKAGGPYPVLGVEQVLMLDPDIVLNAAIAEAHGAERITKDTPGWRSVGAVQRGNVTPLTDESVLRPGPRVGEAVAIVARAIHPGVAIP